MPVKPLPYKSLSSLIKAFLYVRPGEGSSEELIEGFAQAGRRGYLTKSELERVCAWKSPRVMKQIRRNNPADIRRITCKAFSSASELDKMKILVRLHGVGIPMASAILMFTEPKRYPVIDIRGWQLLRAMKAVSTNERGVNLTPEQWVEFLNIVRSYARKLGVTPRAVQQALFQAHKEFQEGRLYSFIAV